MGYWRNFEYTTPKPVEDGIKARTRRGEFGESQIGKRWIEVLESFGKSNRLSGESATPARVRCGR